MFKLRSNFVWLRWCLLLLCIVSVARVAKSEPEEDWDEIFPLPDYVDPDPDDPNDATECIYQRTAYFHTERWIVDECSRCFCNNGTTNCVYESCPTLNCDFFDQVKIEGECCKKCPPEMIVSRTESMLHNTDPIIEGKNQELKFDVGVEIQKQKTSRSVHGEGLWKIGAWISKNFDGSGDRLFMTDNVLSQEQQDSSFTKPGYPPWIFANMTLNLNGKKKGLCEDFIYLCIHFNEGDDVRAQFNLKFSFGPQNIEESRLVACSLLPDCQGVVIEDFQWSIESAASGLDSLIDLNVDFREGTRDLEGSALWHVSLFGSNNEDGVGHKFSEVSQILNQDQASIGIQNAEPMEITDIRTQFDLRTIGCTPDITHICLEISKGENSEPDFTLDFVGEDGDIANVESSVNCIPNKCEAKAIFTELQPELVAPRALIENTPGQRVTLNINAVTDKELSTRVDGNNLWHMNVFFSKRASGTGRRIDEQFQILIPVKHGQSLNPGSDLYFDDVEFEVDLSHLVCEDIPFMCTELKKNPSSSIDYEFGTKPSQVPFVGCLDMSEICRGIIAKDLEWGGEFPNFLDGPIQPIQTIVSNASVDVESVSRDVIGNTLWQMSVFASSSAEANPEDILPPYFEQILTDEQSGLPVPEDGILRFYNMETPPFQVDRMGCGKYRFLCYEFKKAQNTDVDFTFNEESGGKTVLNCQEMECQAVTPDILDWTIDPGDSRPGSKTPVTLNVDAIFKDDTRDISGDRLWRLGLFGSKFINGTGQKFGEVYQVLGEAEVGLPVVNKGPINFGTLTPEFEIGTIGCVEGLNYVCLELAKNADPSPDYVMLIEGDGSFNTKAVVSCKMQECAAKVVFESLSASFPDGYMMIEEQADQLATVDLEAVTNKVKSTAVSGQDLWTMATFFSIAKGGRGARIREQVQILQRAESSQDLIRDQDLLFSEQQLEVDLSGVHCRSIPYICFELRKNEQASINYNFKPDPSRELLIHCQSTDEICKGAVARFLSWTPHEDDTDHVPGELSPIMGDVTVDFVPISRDVEGTNLWQLSTFASSDPDGENKVGPSFEQVLSRPQTRTPLTGGGPLIFRNVITPPYPIDQLGCGDTKYLCFELRKSEASEPDFAFENTEGGEAVKECVEHSCDAVYLDALDWTLAYDSSIPGQLSPIDLDVNAHFDINSKPVDGEDLWQVAFFGSRNAMGEGERFGEVEQVLSDVQSSQPIDADFAVNFEDAEAMFDIGSVGCTDFSHVCIELKKAPNPSKKFTLIIPSEGDALPKSAIISCKPKPCGSRVFFTDLEPTIQEPEILVESVENTFQVDLKAYSDKVKSTAVTGESLWMVNSYFSDREDGLGERLLQTTQILDYPQASQDLFQGDDLLFDQAIFALDLDATCAEMPYMCFELVKNPAASINYQFGDVVRKCKDISDRCKGVVFSDLAFTANMPPFELGVKQTFGIDAVVSAEPYSRGVSGSYLWDVEVFTSPNPEGTIKTESYVKKPFGTTLPPGGPLVLPEIISKEVDMVSIGCGDQSYICVEFSRGISEQPEYSFEVASGGDSLISCQDKKCEGSWKAHTGIFLHVRNSDQLFCI